MAEVDYTPKNKADTYSKFAGKYSKFVKPTKKLYKSEERIRSTDHIPSLVTPGYSTAPKVIPQCTLPNLLGISIVHKSCLQPIFSREQAIDVATMRR